MNTHDLDAIWNCSRSGASPNPDKVMQLVRREETREKRRKIRMALFGFNLTLASVLGAWALASGKTTLSEAWPALVCLVTLGATYVTFLVARRRMATGQGLTQHDIRSVLETLLRRTRASLKETLGLLAVNILTVIPLTIASVQGLTDSGKMSQSEAMSFAFFALVVFGLNIAVLAFYGLTRLRPSCLKLEEQVANFAAQEV